MHREFLDSCVRPQATAVTKWHDGGEIFRSGSSNDVCAELRGMSCISNAPYCNPISAQLKLPVNKHWNQSETMYKHYTINSAHFSKFTFSRRGLMFLGSPCLNPFLHPSHETSLHLFFISLRSMKLYTSNVPYLFHPTSFAYPTQCLKGQSTEIF